MSLNFLSLFSGIGAFEKALDNLGIEYNLVNYCEIDKYASKSYAAIHNVPESLNLGDITKVDTSKLSDIDIITYGFPCQDISLAGKQKGLFNDDGTQTRSGLFFEALRLIEDTKPKVAIAENVKNLVGKKFKTQFEIVLDSLDKAGYNNYWQILRASNYGIPQARDRVFIVSIRKDVDNGTFNFPKSIDLELSVKDLLEDSPDDSLYFTETQLERIKNTKYSNDSHKLNTNKLLRGEIETWEIMDYRYDEGLRIRKNKLCPTLTTRANASISGVPIIYQNGRFRYLSVIERFRLMGFDDKDYYNAKKVNDDPQLFKQAGNSIVVDVLEYLFKEIMEVLDMKKIEEVRTITYECDDLIDLALLKEKEPELYKELLADYPAENATYIFKNKTA